MNVGGATASRLTRLSSLDRMFLHLETRDWPGHFGGLAVLEENALLDGSGRLRLPEIQERIERRLSHVPQLRRRLHFPGPLGGKPLWVDDHRFDISHHVHEAAVEAPGDDPELLDAATRLYGRVLDRRRPLWELWFLTGVSGGRVGVLLKLHHAVADGMAAVAVLGSLLDLQPDAPDPPRAPWAPEPVPETLSLVADNLSGKVRTLGSAAAMLAHPLRLAEGARARVRAAREPLRRADALRTSINQVVRSRRRLGFLRMDLGAMKSAAHVHGAKVNDVVLNVWSGGLRALMLHRNEPTSGIELITNMPVSLRRAGGGETIGNEWGAVAVPLPVWEPDALRRLDLIAETTRMVKTEQEPALTAGFLAVMSAMPLAKYFSAHQHSVNVRVSNVIGPPVPVYALGARVLDVLPIMRLFGNVGLVVCAFSYAGQISLVVTADASAFPDLDVLMKGMERDWHALIDAPGPQPIAGDMRSAGVPARGG
jgi:diacylglycerol O-acyltransferase / wax synthase